MSVTVTNITLLFVIISCSGTTCYRDELQANKTYFNPGVLPVRTPLQDHGGLRKGVLRSKKP